ncbi:glycosyl hydrolase family 98 C- domain protein [Gigaspora margarita]|uniref:Glycosyl hydrolase family 98 C- domain protein n=1 Tax=Gigaspora margarita TaxID=4874 RepID=A0A8H3XI09_GIGMA|nr:glycosyl hydrolase family 98 C- domain protein [Gigaspora margarita]
MSNNDEKTSQALIEIRETRFILMHLKEEWEMAEKNLAKRKSLMLGHFSAASITILLGICLLLISKYNFFDKISTIVTSSITTSGSILVLIRALLNKASANKDNITKVIREIKSGEKAENIPELIDLDKDELKILKIERHQNYIKFLSRINYLIRLERKYGIWFVILMSLFILILASITILVNVSSIYFPLPNLSQYFAEGIIACGILWLINIILSHLTSFYENMSNWHWKSADINGNMNLEGGLFRIFLFIAIIPGLILLAPISIFYMLMKRTYIIDEDARDNIDENKVDNGNKVDDENKVDNGNKVDDENKVDNGNKVDDENKVDNGNKVDDENKVDNGNKVDDELFIINGNKVDDELFKFAMIIAKKITDTFNEDKDVKEENKCKPNVNEGLKCSEDDNKESERKENVDKDDSDKFNTNKTKENNNEAMEHNVKEENKSKSKDVNEELKCPKAVNKELECMGIVVKDEFDLFETFKTTNDDEAMKLAIKIINKNCNFKVYLNRHDKKFFSFRKIYRHNIKEHFWELFKKVIFRKKSMLIFKIEDIKLTKKHKLELRRLLCGLEYNKKLIMKKLNDYAKKENEQQKSSDSADEKNKSSDDEKNKSSDSAKGEQQQTKK